MKSYYIIIRGPPAVGKTAVADKLRSTLQGKTVHLDLDQLRMMPYRAGGSGEEKKLATQNAIALGRNFVDAGYRVIMEELFYERELIEKIERELPPPAYQHKVFLLNASLETCLQRNQGRKYQLKEEQVERLYHSVLSLELVQKVIQTEQRTIEEIVEEMLPYLPKI